MRVLGAVTATMILGAALALSEEARAEALSPDAEEFLTGAASHTIHHEIAHMLIDRFQLPVVGREEDAADQYAWLRMIDRWRVTGDEAPIHAAVRLWHLEHRRAANEDDRVPAWSEHASDRQRLFQGICLVAGLEPEVFGDLADRHGMPQDRLDACAEEAELVEAAWMDLLELTEPAGNEPLRLKVEEATSRNSSATRDSVDRSELAVRRGVVPARRIVEELNREFSFSADVTLRFASCGEADAYYDPEAAEVLICFEEIDGYLELLEFR